MLPSHVILASLASPRYRGKCIKMHHHTLETPLKVSRIYFVLQSWQVSTIFSILIVEATWRRLKVIFIYAHHQDTYTSFFEKMPYVGLDTSNAIETLLSGNAQRQKIEAILKGVLNKGLSNEVSKKGQVEMGSHFSAVLRSAWGAERVP